MCDWYLDIFQEFKFSIAIKVKYAIDYGLKDNCWRTDNKWYNGLDKHIHVKYLLHTYACIKKNMYLEEDNKSEIKNQSDW